MMPRLTLIIAIFLFASCGGSGIAPLPDTPSAEDLEGDEWRQVSSGIEAGLQFNSPTGTLTIINHSRDTVGTPEVYTFDEETGERVLLTLEEAHEIEAGQIFQTTVIHPNEEGPGDDAVLGLRLGSREQGRFHDAETFEDLLPIVQEIEPIVIATTPTQGTWSYSLSFSSINISGESCLSSAMELASSSNMLFSGTGELTVSDNGLVAVYDIGGQKIFMDMSSLSEGGYQNQQSFFGTNADGETVAGTLAYSFTVPSPELIQGTGTVDDGLGCNASFSFAMAFVEPVADNNVTEICEGTWTITYDIQPFVFFCLGGSATLTKTSSELPNFPNDSVEISVLKVGDYPYMIFLNIPNADPASSLPLANQSGTNLYGSLYEVHYLTQSIQASQIPGIPSYQAIIAAGFELDLLAKDSMQGYVRFHGGTCFEVTYPVTLSHSGC